MPRGRELRALVAAIVAVIGCAAALTGVPSRASAAALTAATWTASSSETGATGVTYTYTLTVATAGPLNSVTMTVPSGTGGAPAVGSATTPSSVADGAAVTLAGTTLTYTFATATYAAGTVLSIAVTGLTNTGTAGDQTATITTRNGTDAIDAGPAAFTFTGSALTSAAWTAASTVVGATDTRYTYAFTTASLALVTQVTITVPPGTGGTPALGTVSGLSLDNSVSLSGSTLTFTGPGTEVASGTRVSIEVTGLTNTYTAGTYMPQIVTRASVLSVADTPLDSAVAPAVTFPGGLLITAPASLTWNGALTGASQVLADTNGTDEQLVVNDQTDTADGWNVTVAATSFTNGSGYSLPGTSVLQVTGSVTSSGSVAAPSAVCLGTQTCTPPSGPAVTYPVTVTSTPPGELPAPEMVYQAQAASGVGPVAIGGPAAANPVGWWLNISGGVEAGTYASTITVAVSSGP